jgi:glycosyltransferase involved in cell wall biosynthesis
MKTISAIICAYNEENTISSVIEATHSCPYIDQIVVINDGSTDRTGQIVSQLSESIDLTYFHLQPNRGKGFSMATGLELSTGEIIVFLDADLVNLDQLHLDKLLFPILDGNVDMVMGQPGQTFIHTSLNPFKALTGQRVVKRENILPIVEDIKLTRFGVETYINIYYQSECLNVRKVILENLAHPTKFGKMKIGQAILELLKEGKEIIWTIINNTYLLKRSLKRQIFKKQLTLD